MALNDEVRPNLGVNPTKSGYGLRGRPGTGTIATAQGVVRGRRGGTLAPGQPSNASLAAPSPDILAAYNRPPPATTAAGPGFGMFPGSTPPLPGGRSPSTMGLPDWGTIAAQALAQVRARRGW